MIHVEATDLPLTYRPGNPITLELTWPSSLVGRTFTATLGSGATDETLTCTVDGSVLTVEATGAQTTAATPANHSAVPFVLTETTGDDTVLIAAQWRPTDRGTGSTTAASVTVTVEEVAVAVTLVAAGGVSAALTAHIDDPVGAHAASAVSFAPTGTVAATTVQAAIAEVATDAAASDLTYYTMLHLDPRVAPYNARFDTRTFANGAMTSGSALLTIADYAFSAADVGKLIKVTGAGVAGASLKTTIAGFDGSGRAVLTVAASTTVAGTAGNIPSQPGNVVFGTDDTAAIQACLDAAVEYSTTTAANPVRSVRRVRLPQGMALISQLIMPRRFHLEGAGWGNFGIIYGFGFEQTNNTLLYQKWDENKDAIIFRRAVNNVDYVGPGTLRDFLVQQDLDNSSGSGIAFRDPDGTALTWQDGMRVSNISSDGFADYGWHFPNGCVPGHFVDCKAYMNVRAGVYYQHASNGSIMDFDGFSGDQNGECLIHMQGGAGVDTRGVVNVRSLKSEATTNVYRVPGSGFTAAASAAASRQEYAIVMDRMGGALVNIYGLDHIAGSGEASAPAAAIKVLAGSQTPVISWSGVYVRVLAGQTGTPVLIEDPGAGVNIPLRAVSGTHTTGGELGRYVLNTTGAAIRMALTTEGDWFGATSENPGIQLAGEKPTLSLAALAAGTNQVVTNLEADSTGVVRFRTYTTAGAADEDVIKLARTTVAGTSTLTLASSSAGASLAFFGTAGTTKQTVTGKRTDGTALTALLTALAAYGIVVDGTTDDAILRLAAQVGTPAAPASGINLYNRTRAGRDGLVAAGATGLARNLNQLPFDKTFSLTTPISGSTVRVHGYGAGFGNSGTVTTVAATAAVPTVYNIATAASAGAVAHSTNGTPNRVVRGAATDVYAGFFLHTRVLFPDASYNNTGAGTGTRLWGLGAYASGASTTLTGDRGGTQIVLGFCREHVNGANTDTNWRFVTNNGAGGITAADTSMAFAVNKVYDFWIWCPAGSTTVYWQVDNVTDGTTQTGSATTNLGAASTFLTPIAGVGTVDAVARNIQIARGYVEVDRG